MTKDQTIAAIDDLLASKSPKELAALLDARDNLRLFNNEHVKQHPLSTLELTDAQWGEFSAHMLDGGGVRQDEMLLDGGPSLRDRFHVALQAGDRQTTLHLLPHLVKSMMKRTGMRRQLAAGGVSAGPVGSAKTPDAAQVARAWPGRVPVPQATGSEGK